MAGSRFPAIAGAKIDAKVRGEATADSRFSGHRKLSADGAKLAPWSTSRETFVVDVGDCRRRADRQGQVRPEAYREPGVQHCSRSVTAGGAKVRDGVPQIS